MDSSLLADKKNNQTLKRIMMNALQQFSQYGYEGVSIRDITRASAVTKPTLYYYFKNKEELYRSLANTSFEEIFSNLKKAASQGATSFARILNFFNVYCQLCNEHYYLVRFVHTTAINPSRSVPDIDVFSFGKKITEIIEGVINDGASSGEIKVEKVPYVICAVNSIIQMRVTSILTLAEKISDISAVEGALKIVLEGC